MAQIIRVLLFAALLLVAGAISFIAIFSMILIIIMLHALRSHNG